MNFISLAHPLERFVVCLEDEDGEERDGWSLGEKRVCRRWGVCVLYRPLCGFIPVHGGCGSFTHVAPLRALAEMEDVLGSADESGYLDGFSGRWVAFLLQPKWRSHERKK